MKTNQSPIRVLVVAGLALLVLFLVASSVAAGPPAARSTIQTRPGLAGGAAAARTAWSSGWVPINQGQTLSFTHDLGRAPEEYGVELWFRDTDGGMGINRYGYGGLEASGVLYGAHWQNLTSNTIQVYRQPGDTAADMIRILVWVPPTTPGFDSGWTGIDPGQTLTFNHDLAITDTDLTVAVWFSGTLGIHHYAYGGLAIDAPTALRGAYWRNLTNTSVQVTRYADDTDAEQIRVTVTQTPTPDYDSLAALGAWQSIAPGTVFTFTHGLAWNPDMLLVRGECYDPTPGGLGIHHQYAGGNHDSTAGWQGTYIRNLTRNTVTIARQTNDTVCPQSRVVIIRRRVQTYLPFVLRSF